MEIKRQSTSDVRSLLNAGSASAAEKVENGLAEDVAEHAKNIADVLETADAAVPFETGASISIVDVLLLGIVQNLKRLGAKFKLRLGLFVPWITVRMILQRGLPIC